MAARIDPLRSREEVPLIWTLTALAHTPVLHEVRADMNWCGFVNGRVESAGLLFEPGDVALFQPGTYTGACDFEALETTEGGELTILQSADVASPARFEHDGSSPYLWRVTGTSFFLTSFDFGPIPAGVEAVRLQDAREGWVRYAAMPRVDGIGVGLHGTCTDLDVLDLRIEAGDGRGVDVQCTEGSDVNVAGGWLSLADGVSVVGSGVTVADNTFDGARLQLDADVVVERNLFVASDVPLEHLGGDLLFRGNIVEADRAATFGDGTIALLGNTFRARLDAPQGARVEANALLEASSFTNNVVCDASCYVDAASRDLFPSDSSPLLQLDSLPDDIGTDFCQQERTEPVAGALAVDDSAGPIPIGFKSDLPCTFADLPSRGTPEAREDEPVSKGCVTAHGSWLLMVYIPLFLRTRRPGDAPCS